MIFINAAIGIGKTSLTKILTEDLGTQGFYENVDDVPMLKEFYAAGEESRERLAFPLQVDFLLYRFRQLRRGLYLAEHNGMVNTVYDSSLLSDAQMSANLHRRGEFPDSMYNLYVQLNQEMVADVAGHPFNGFPDLVVFLDAPFELMLDHIKLRGREMEITDPELVDYYYSVWETYDNWRKSFSGCAMVTIDMNKYDFVNNLDDRNTVLNQIEQKLVDLGKLSQSEFDEIRARREPLTRGLPF